MIVDDLHDASPRTVDALGATINRLAGPVLVCCWAGRSWCAPAGADPTRRRRGAYPAAAARRRRRPAAHGVPERRPAAARRHRPPPRHRPGQPVLPLRAGHAAAGARRADHGERRPGRPAHAASVSTAGQLPPDPSPPAQVLAARIDALPAGTPRGAAGRGGGRRHRADAALDALREQRSTSDSPAGRRRRGRPRPRRGRAVAPPDAPAGPGRLHLRDPRCCARRRTRVSARPISPTGTPAWPAGPPA